MKKKTLLFFSRSELVHLYGSISKYLVNDFEVIHVAYSSKESDILENIYSIKVSFVFKNELKIAVDSNNYISINELDQFFISETAGRFNLNGAIQIDRTFCDLNYNDAVELTSIYYRVWEKILNSEKIDFFIHEPTSLMMNHVASLFCRKLNIFYTTHILVPGEAEFNFIMLEFDDGYPTELISNYCSISDSDLIATSSRVKNFLYEFRSSYNIFYDFKEKGGIKIFAYLRLILSALKEDVLFFLFLGRLDRKIDLIEIFLLNNRLSKKRILNLLSYSNRIYDFFDHNKRYYFYPIHLEPEAVVLYWSDGIYSNQIKLIENIASQLPPNVYLYVKDHPHLLGYRSRLDYEKLKNIPNVKLLNPELPGKEIIKYALGVITLNGTAGFEALLLNKHILTFGHSFYRYSKRVKYVPNIKDLRKILYDLEGLIYEDDDELYKFVLAYLLSTKTGFTNYFSGAAKKLGIDVESNSMIVAGQLKLFFNKV